MTVNEFTYFRRTTRRWFLALCLLTCARSVFALGAQPSYQVFTLKAGERTDATVILSNNEDMDLNITPTVKDWFISPNNKAIKTADWLKTDLKPFSLNRGEQKTIKFTAQAPKKATGEVMGMLTFTTKPQTGSMVSFRLSLATYVVIKGTEKKEGEPVAIAVSVSSDTTVSYLFSNKGNVHLRPKGLIKIFDDKDQQILNVIFDATLPTYPGKKQGYSSRIRNYHMQPGRYTAEFDLEDADWNITYPPQKKSFTYKHDGILEAR